MRHTTFRTFGVVFTGLVVLAALACSDSGSGDPVSVTSTRPASILSSAPVNFTVGPLALRGIDVFTPGGNLHFRNVALSGPVTGDISGTADFMLNADLDGSGNGPTWGTVTITSGGVVWQGNFTGHFQGDLPTGILLTSQLIIHGPDQQLLKLECDEIPPSSSETLACSGTIQEPHQ